MAQGDTFFTCGTCGMQRPTREALAWHQQRVKPPHRTIIEEVEGEIRDRRPRSLPYPEQARQIMEKNTSTGVRFRPAVQR